MDKNIKKIKQYGLRRSGTNLAKNILESNYHVDIMVNREGWKHGVYKMKNPTDIIVVIKGIYSWLVSIYNYVGKGETFSEFIRSEYNVKMEVYSKGDLRAYQEFTRKNPIIHWNFMNNHWLCLDIEKKIVPMFYEDMIIGGVDYFNRIAKILDIEKKFDLYSVGFKYPKNTLLMGMETTSESNFVFNVDYYHRQLYLDEYSDKDMKFIMKYIDRNLMEKLKCEIIEI